MTRSGGLGVMSQLVPADQTVHDLLLSVAPPRVRAATAEVDRLELALMDAEDEATQLRYAAALADYADAGGYDAEVLWDACCTAALGVGFDRARFRDLDTLSGGEQKRLVLEALLRGPDEVLLLDEPDTFSTARQALAGGRLAESPKTVLYVSHDRELLANTATGCVTVSCAPRQRRLGGDPAASRATTPPGGTASPARGAASALGQDRAMLRALMLMYSRRPRTTPTWPAATTPR